MQLRRKGGRTLEAEAPPPPPLFLSQSEDVICRVNTFKCKEYMPLEPPHIETSSYTAVVVTRA